MINRDHYVEDDFELEKFKNDFISKRNSRISEKNRLRKEKIQLKIAGFIIMVVAITLGSLLYSFISKLILEYLY